MPIRLGVMWSGAGPEYAHSATIAEVAGLQLLDIAEDDPPSRQRPVCLGAAACDHRHRG